jgi:assimilatory nitrate reductase catalytic subunit
LTEDYYVANKLMKGFIGSGNVDTNSRLCMSSTVAGHRRVFGSDTVPGAYEDMDEADLIVLVGSNAAWCHPILFQRMARARETQGARVVTLDVRGMATSESADLALTIEPGMDGVLFCGLLVHLADSGRLDQAYIDAHTQGFGEALVRARSIAPDVGDDRPAVRSRARRRLRLLRDVERNGTRRHALQPGRQSIGARYRQGRCDPQLSSGDRAAGARRDETVFADRAAQCDGRARSRR